MKGKRLTVRLSNKEEKALKDLKEAIEKEHHIEHNDSDTVRFAINYALKLLKEKGEQ